MQPQQIKLDEITDIKELKALAFDAMQIIEMQRSNLQAIRGRMQEVAQEVDKEPEPKKEETAE
jgi:hypothetical protein